MLHVWFEFESQYDFFGPLAAADPKCSDTYIQLHAVEAFDTAFACIPTR